MPERVVEEPVHGGGGSMGVLAVVLILIALLAVLYFTGVFGSIFGKKDTNINIDVNKPSVILPLK
jgi:hypothetical protein